MHKPTNHTHLLTKALHKRNILTETEFPDGHKHVDIYIPENKMYIEIEGLQHFTKPEQIISDLKRDYYSDRENHFTFRIPNQFIDTHLEEIADAIAHVVKSKQNIMNSPLTNKIIVITGGSSGLGKSLSDQLIQKGAHVIVLARKETDMEHHIVDVTDLETVKSVTEKIITKHHHIDIWINNAGIWMPKENTETLDLEKGKKLFDVNVFGTMNGIQAVLPYMKKQGKGMIVNIVSTTAFDGMNGSSGIMYVGSKYALRGITNTLRDELKETKLHIIGVYPGGFKSDIFKDNKPATIDEFMSAADVAEKIIKNLELDQPETEHVLKRPGQ